MEVRDSASRGRQIPVIAEDFGQKIDLTRRIREVLANYPEGTTILKELLQNADDAGATKVCFCLDRRRHGVESLLFKELGGVQGPALLAYNDAQFSEEDFQSISRLGDSKKQAEAWKTGRFGIGFNSVYHLSDLPSFVSGRHIVFFDPQCTFFERISTTNPGKRIEFVNSGIIRHYRDQFFPYCAFGCDMETFYSGTLFRFPLRTIEQAAVSQLSKEFFSEEDILSLLHEFHLEAVLAMLFLKNVEVIEIYKWQDGSDSPDHLYSCYLKSSTPEVCWHRQALLRLSRAWPFSVHDSSSIAKQINAFTMEFVLKRTLEPQKVENKTQSFLIVQCMEASTSRIGTMATNTSRRLNLRLLPWASVGADISHDNDKAEDKIRKDGQAFCFLPLPVKTGLPVHVNGYFELSSNRRDIWHGDDLERGGKLRSDWNTLLLEDVVASAYCHLLSIAHRFLGSYQSCYSLWPSGSFLQPWQNMVIQLYRNVAGCPVLYSDVEGGKWIMPWQAIFHDQEFSDADKLANALIAEGLPVVCLPKPLLNMLYTYSGLDLNVVFPKLIREFLKKPGKHGALASRAWGLTLLEYCLGDVVDEEAAEMLSGLPLVPLSNGEFGVFGKREDAHLFFVCSDVESILLDSVKDMLVDRKIPHEVLDRLSQIARVSGTNICLITPVELAKSFTRILPAEWQRKEEVEWMPDSIKNHPKKEWIILLWRYLKDHCNDLSVFESWPILPTTRGLLCKVRVNSGIVRGGTLMGSMESLLIDLGCHVLIPGHQIEHPLLSKYVHAANGPGVLDAILAVTVKRGCDFQNMFMNVKYFHRHELRAFLLDPKWYRENQMTDTHLQAIRCLPIFEVYNGSDCRKKSFADITNKSLPPANVNEDLLGLDFLFTHSTEEDEVLIGELGIHRMERSSFYKWRVIDRFNDLSSEVRNQTMVTILKELPQLLLQDSSIKDALKHLAFVPTADGELRSPDSLYDPRHGDLFMLLDEQESFPSDDFRAPEILDMLLLLGLQTSVSPKTLVKSARQIELLMTHDSDKAHARGCLLLSYLQLHLSQLIPQPLKDVNRSIDRFLTKVVSILPKQDPGLDVWIKFWDELATICWCPVLVHSPYPCLPWPSVSTSVAPPKLIRLQPDVWLASASMRILDGECHSVELSSRLGWNAPLPGNVIAAQLLELGKIHATLDKRDIGQALASTIPRMYARLTKMIGTDEMDVVKAILDGSRWVWVGDGFVNTWEVVLSGPIHLAPYLHIIPADLLVFKELLTELGVKETLTPSEFALALSKMAKIKNGLPLDVQELKAAIWIVQHLADLHFQGQGMELFVPDNNATLFPSSKLVYNDAPWLLIGESIGKSENLYLRGSLSVKEAPKFVHANISIDVAERLGVCSLRRSLLAESADYVNLSLHDAAEAFGQHEALTTRLKHIVEMYADGPGILHELVQNADDAGASEIIFLVDKSEYGSSSVLSPGMSQWQGPALYCFNNSVFTAEDLHSISRIGQDSKLEKPHTVGRFGLGFNCVYHFTDVPGFVSGENLVIFDPHATYLPGISPSQPGLKINFSGKAVLEQFPDQCCPYLLFGCDMKKPFQGTLFRFPLRNTATAACSQIKQEAYTPQMVLDLFSSFRISASEVLIFLHNVLSITVYARGGLHQDMEMLYRVNKHPVLTEVRQSGSQRIIYDFVRGDSMDKEHFYGKLQRTPDDRLPWDCRKMIIDTTQDGAEGSQVWIVSDSLGGKQAKTMAISKENRVRGFVPWAGVAAKLQENIEISRAGSVAGDPSVVSTCTYSPLEGRAFCFLPLPLKINLPVHVNGYFELSSNRRDIWFGDDMSGGGKLRSDWNCCLLKDVASPSYVRLLARATYELGPSEEYYSLWPVGSVLEPWASLLCGVYVAAVDLDLPVLYTTARGGQWISAKQAVFPDHSFFNVNELGIVLANAGLTIVHAPKSIVCKFKANCPSLRYLTPQLLRGLLVTHKFALRDRDARIIALNYCLHDIEGAETVQKLKGLPLIPLCTGSMGTFRNAESGERIFIGNGVDFNLLKDTLPEMLVDCSIEGELFQKLHVIAQSGSTNLTLLTPNSLKDLLPRLIPAEWQGKVVVRWTPGQGHPSQQWMELLWGFLNSTSADLSIFSEWPLLPASDGHLLQLKKDSCVLQDGKWSENIVAVLQKACCFMLKTDMCIDHPNLGEYVQDATASGILNGLLSAASGKFASLNDLFKRASECEIRDLRGFLLQRRWFTTGRMDSKHLETLKALPIYFSCGNSQFVNLADLPRWLAPDDVDRDLLGEEFIYAESEKEEHILKTFLGVVKFQRKEFFEHYVLNRIHQFPADIHVKIMLRVLRDLPSLAKEIPSIKSTLSEIPFVKTAQGNLEVPARLYDPRVSELQLLLHRHAFFPAKEFEENDILDALVQLGLKRCLGHSGLLDSARSVEMLSGKDEQEAFERGKALFMHLNGMDFADESVVCHTGTEQESLPSVLANLKPTSEHIMKEEDFSDDAITFGNKFRPIDESFLENVEESEEQFWAQLRNISWCPVYLDPPLPAIPWPKEPIGLTSPPKIVRPKSQIWHVSASMRILQGDSCSSKLMEKLGWLERPSVVVLAVQLIELSKKYLKPGAPSSSVQVLEDNSETEEDLDQILQREIPSLYKLLQEFVGTEDMLVLQSMLEGVPWVWIGDTFVSSRELAFDSPAHFKPYLHVVSSDLSCFKTLFTALGVRATYDIADYFSVLQRISVDAKGGPLNSELLEFALRVVETIGEFLLGETLISGEIHLDSLLIPDANGVLAPAKDLVYNDAPWLAVSSGELAEVQQFVHAGVHNELAERLGAKSLRYLSLVDMEMTRDLPCLPSCNISKLLTDIGDKDHLLFDLLEVADCCKAQKMHAIYDKREHSRTSILQSNLGQFQGPSLTVAFEGAELSTEEICSLQTSLSWKIRGSTNHYGGGLLSCYNISDILLLVSGGCLYLFDPSGLILAASLAKGKPSPSARPIGKVYTLRGTDLVKRFADQFQPLYINDSLSWVSPNVTILRMPLRIQSLSADCETTDSYSFGDDIVQCIFEKFRRHASKALLLLNSVEDVYLSTWEAGEETPHEHFAVRVDPACTILRNPFEEKKWRKFQFSTIFGNQSNSTKLNIIDVFTYENGHCVLDKWLVALSFGSGQTRNMALDRKYLSYNLIPVAGVAAHLSQNGAVASSSPENCILAPLPLTFSAELPVTILGHFIVSKSGIRHLFHGLPSRESSTKLTGSAGKQYASLPIFLAWNKELMTCVHDSYIELLVEFQRWRQDMSVRSTGALKGKISRRTFNMSMERAYSLWPLSRNMLSKLAEPSSSESLNVSFEYSDKHWFIKLLIKPMYLRLADLPLWQLHGGTMVKATEGMFLSHPQTEQRFLSPPATVCEFLMEHYRVFAVPWELVNELEAAGISIKMITPKMVRTIVKTSLVSHSVYSVERHVDLLEYCCADLGIQASEQSEEQACDSENSGSHRFLKASSSSDQTGSNQISGIVPHEVNQEESLGNRTAGRLQTGGDAMEIIANIGRVLLDLGKEVVDDLNKEIKYGSASQIHSTRGSENTDSSRTDITWMSELKGLPCPTATAEVVKLGMAELWIGNEEQQFLLLPLAKNFVHTKCLERPLLSKVFGDDVFQKLLRIKPFTPQLLASNMRSVLPKSWVRKASKHAAAPWISWEYTDRPNSGELSSGWLRAFWKNVNPYSAEELSFFSQWHLIPGVMISSVLIKVQSSQLVFIPPSLEKLEVQGDPGSSGFSNSLDVTEACKRAFLEIEENFPWLFSFLQSCSVPIFDRYFLDCGVVNCCLPGRGESLGQVVRAKLLASQQAGFFVASELSLLPTDCDALFSLFASDFCFPTSTVSTCSTAELNLIRSLPIFKTTTGHYTAINQSLNCVVLPGAFLQPHSNLCLQYYPLDSGGLFYRALGIPELTNEEILLRFGFPGFEDKSDIEQKCILSYLSTNWDTLQHDNAVVATLRDTKFVNNQSLVTATQLFQPQELLDPADSLLQLVYAGDDSKFPGGQFRSERWLDILRKVGLRSASDAAVLLNCARNVEGLGKQNVSALHSMDGLESKDFSYTGDIPEEVWSMAGILVEAILGNFAFLYDSSFCESLRQIAFIPANRGIPNTGGNSGKRVLASYSELVLLKDWPLAWTCSPIIARESLTPPNFSWASLHLRSPPHFPTVLRHLQMIGKNGGEDILAGWPIAQGVNTVEDAFCDILKYLNSIWGSLSDMDKMAVASLQFIPVGNGTRLCTANTLYIRLGMNLAPFVFELPSSYLPFVKVLKDLGMQDLPTLDNMRNLLLQLQEACGYQRLNPNELRAIMRLLDFICEEALKVASDTKQFPEGAKGAVVPDDMGRLVHAQACVYVDALGSSLVGKIDSSRVRFVHAKLSEKLCIQLGVRKLSDVVVEVLNEDLQLEPVDYIGSVSRSAVVEKLQNKYFEDAIWAVVKDFGQQLPSLKCWTKDKIEKRINHAAARLQFVRCLYTRCIMLPGNVDVTRQLPSNSSNSLGSSLPREPGYRVYEYVDKDKYQVFVAEPPGFVSVADLLTVLVSKLLDSPVCLPLHCLFNAPLGSEGDLLKIVQLCQHDNQEDRSKAEQSTAPGQEILASDVAQLQFYPLRPFYGGEIVAWQCSGEKGAKLRYGLVLEDVRASAGEALYRLQVETSPGEVQCLLSSDVFSFKSMTSARKIGSQNEPSLLTMSQPAFNSLADLTKDTEGKQKYHTIKVTPVEVVRAVNDMLIAAGLPMGLEQQSLLNQALTLKEQLTTAHAALTFEQERADTAVKEVDSTRAAWTCRICLTSEVDTVLVPCGHVLCQRCSTAVARCPFCRQHVSKSFHMYRP